MNKLILRMMLVALVVFTVPAASAEYNVFYLEPVDSSCNPGDTTTVWVMVNTSYNDINAFQASIIFDPNVVNITHAVAGTPDWYLWEHIYGDYGDKKYISLRGADLLNTYGPGELQLGQIALHGEANGISSLHFGNESELGQDRTEISTPTGNIWPITTEDGTFTCGSVQTFTKSLPAGWNLISLPLTPVDNTTDTVLSGVTHNAVKRYDATSKVFVDVTTMDPGTGYFVHVTSASAWEYVGDSVSSTTSDLKSGLNMIGVPNCGMSVGDAMGTTDYRYAARWNATSQSYEVYNPNAPEAFHGFNTMEAGEGYFASAMSDGALTVTCS